MNEVIALLPEILAPLIIGGTFVFIFKAGALKMRDNSYESRWITYYLFGFIIHYIGQAICEALNIQINTKTEYLLFCAGLSMVSCVCAFLLSKIYRSKLFNEIRIGLGIHDDLEGNYWTTINDSENGVRAMAYFRDSDRIIEGAVHYVEANQQHPQIALSDYNIYINGGETLLEGHADEDNCLITFDTTKCDFIQLFYSKGSRVLASKKIYKDEINNINPYFATIVLLGLFSLMMWVGMR